jgi:C4-dicarboxylate-binding protein DctP
MTNGKEGHMRSYCCKVILALLLAIGVGSDAVAATPLTLRLSTAGLVNDIGPQADKLFLDLVQARSNGRIQTKFFPGGTLGQGPELVSLTKAGSLEGYSQALSFLSESIPYVSIVDLPLVFSDSIENWVALDGDLGNRIKEDVQKIGLKILTFCDYGSRDFVMAKKPILRAEDLKGVKVRSLPSPIMVKTYESFGAKPIQLTVNEVFTALQTGQIDGLDWSASATIVRKYYEVAKYLTVVGLYRQTNSITLNKKWFDSLPQDLQKIVEDSARVATDWGRMEQERDKESALKKLKSLGVKVNVLGDSERAKLRGMMKPVYDMLRKDYPKELVEMVF